MNGELPDQDDLYSYYCYFFEAVVENKDERELDRVIFSLNSTNEEALERLMKGLNVLDRDVAYSSNSA